MTTLIQAHRYWRQKGLDVDLVILNNSPGGYQQGLQNQIMELIYAGSEASLLDKTGGLFVRNGEHLSAEDKLLLMSVACLYLDDRAGSINEQLNQRIHTLKSPVIAFMPRAVRERNQHTDWPPISVSYAISMGSVDFLRMDGNIKLLCGKMRRHRLLVKRTGKSPFWQRDLRGRTGLYGMRMPMNTG